MEEFRNEYMLGEGMLVAPVTRKLGSRSPLALDVPLWVPPGIWLQRHSGLAIVGPRRLQQSFALDEIPIFIKAGAVVFGQPTPAAEWPHCGGGGWLGRAQWVPRCAQASFWLDPAGWATDAGGEGFNARPSLTAGAARLYEDDGWSQAYRSGSSRRTGVWWDVARAGADAAAGWDLTLAFERVVGCTAGLSSAEGHEDDDGSAEGGEARHGAAPSRSWRLLVHGVPPPSEVTLQRYGRDDSPINGSAALQFADPATAERLRRAGEHARHTRDAPLPAAALPRPPIGPDRRASQPLELRSSSAVRVHLGV
jgi:hypothetical protein